MPINKKTNKQIVIYLYNGTLTAGRMRTVGKDLEKVEPLHFAGVMENGAVSVGGSLVSRQKVKHRIAIAILLLGIHTTKLKTGANTCT